MVKAVGIDSGTKSMDIFGFDDETGEVIIDTSHAGAVPAAAGEALFFHFPFRFRQALPEAFALEQPVGILEQRFGLWGERDTERREPPKQGSDGTIDQ